MILFLIANSDIKINPLDIFLDSLRYSKGQVRVMYYGDSQIEGDRITSYLRQTLRKGHGGTGPGLLLPLNAGDVSQSLYGSDHPQTGKNIIISLTNQVSYHTAILDHSWQYAGICRRVKKMQTPEKAYVRIRPSNVADSSSSEYDYLRIFYGNTADLVRVNCKSKG